MNNPTSFFTWEGWEALSAIAVVAALLFAFSLYRAQAQKEKRDRQAEILTMKAAYIHPLTSVSQRCRLRLAGRAPQGSPFEVPAIMREWLGRNWIMGEAGVEMNFLFDRIDAFNLASAPTPDARANPADLSKRLKQIERHASSLRDQFRQDTGLATKAKEAKPAEAQSDGQDPEAADSEQLA